MVETLCSSDGTLKFIFDGYECVLIPGVKNTLCLSCQVGCAVRCSFCVTGIEGLKRNLSSSEIVSQYEHVVALHTVDNIVFMGMGEPMHNLDNVISAIKTLNEKFCVSQRSITVSTVGVKGTLEKFYVECSAKLAVSLHAATDAKRDVLVPANELFPLDELLSELRRLPYTKNRQLLVQYTLIKDVNDSEKDAKELATLLEGLPVKVNVIPFNSSPLIKYERPSDAGVEAFAKSLEREGVRVFVRASRGRDIDAACGMLAPFKR